MVSEFSSDPDYQTMTVMVGDFVSDGDLESNWDEQFFNYLTNSISTGFQVWSLKALSGP